MWPDLSEPATTHGLPPARRPCVKIREPTVPTLLERMEFKCAINWVCSSTVLFRASSHCRDQALTPTLVIMLSMSTEQIVALLIAERDRLNRAIDALQGPTKRPGRPPNNPFEALVAPASATVAPVTKKRSFSAAQRRTQGERMKAYWKKRKAAEAKQ
jgi:hypothetical protein